jgi:hypothetical protein
MKRSTLLLIGVLVALGVVTAIVLQQPGESSSDKAPEMLVTYDSSAVDRLQITSGGSTVTLTLEGGRWMITSPVHYRADENAVTMALSRGRKIEIRGLVSTNPEKQGVFQVDSSATLVQVFERGTPAAAFRIGKAGTTFSETYVRREGSTDVLIGEGPLAHLFVKSPKDWRDRTIFKAEHDKITSIRYRYGDTTFTLALFDSVWKVDSRPASPPVVQNLLSTLTNYLANDFLDSAFTPSTPPAALVELPGTQLRFYRAGEGNRYLVQSSQDPQWYVLEQYHALDVLKRQSDLAAPGVSLP